MVFWLDYNSCSHFRSSQAREQPSSGLKLPDQTTVYANKSIHCIYTQAAYTERNCIYVRCCISFGICLYWGDQVIEYKYVVNLHWGLSLRDLSVFFLFWNFYLNNASSVGQKRCHRSNHLCLSVSFSTQQPMFESMEPAKYIFHHHHQAMFYIW